MDAQELRSLQEAYNQVHQVDENLLRSLDTGARNLAGRVGGNIGAKKGREKMGDLPVLGDIGARQGRNRGTQQGQQMYDKAKGALGGLLKQDYEYDIDETFSQTKVPLSVRKNAEANRVGSREFSNRGGYAGLKAGGGQAALNKGSSVSDTLRAGRQALDTKSKQNFNNRVLNKPTVTSTPAKNPMDDFAAGGGNAKMKQSGMTRDQVVAQGKKNLANSYEPDMFDIVLEYLVAEGYADTNESALAIMSNMSEEWRESIVEATVLAAKGGVAGAVQVKQTKTPGFLGTGIGSRTVSTPIPGTFTRNTPGRQASGPRSFDASGSGSKGAEAEMSDRSGPTDAERNRYNAAVTKNNTVGDKSVEPSPRAVNQRANQKGHSGLMPTRDNQNSTKYAKPNQSWRGY
jgi:hypothetical protein